MGISRESLRRLSLLSSCKSARGCLKILLRCKRASAYRALRKDGPCVRRWCVYHVATMRRPRQAIRRRQCAPFSLTFIRISAITAFYVAINSFSVALKFFKGILNTWRGAASDIDVPSREQNCSWQLAAVAQRELPSRALPPKKPKRVKYIRRRYL